MAPQGARTGSRSTRFGADEMNPKHILETAFAFRASKVLLTAVELGVFKSLASGPQTAAALARTLGLQGRGAGDFFDALVALDFLDRDDNGLYANTLESSAYLDSNSTEYIGDLIEYLNGRVYPTWNFLAQALREGAPQRGPAASGGFSTFYKDPDAFDLFSEGNERRQSSGRPGARKAVPVAVVQYRHRCRERAGLRGCGTCEGTPTSEWRRLRPGGTAGPVRKLRQVMRLR